MSSDNQNIALPDFLAGFFWSYDIGQLDAEVDFRRIATNILVYGDIKALKWLFNHYSISSIKSVVVDPMKGEWDIRSLAFWSEYFGIQPDRSKAIKTAMVASNVF